MKAVKITLAGRTQYLAYTGEAMFQLQEKFGTAAELLGAIGKNTRDGLSVACEAAAILPAHGDLSGGDSDVCPLSEPLMPIYIVQSASPCMTIFCKRSPIPFSLSLRREERRRIKRRNSPTAEPARMAAPLTREPSSMEMTSLSVCHYKARSAVCKYVFPRKTVFPRHGSAITITEVG